MTEPDRDKVLKALRDKGYTEQEISRMFEDTKNKMIWLGARKGHTRDDD